MGRFRVADDDEREGEDDDGNDNHNYFQAQHVYSSSGEEEEDDHENHNHWGPLVQFRQHNPQNNNDNDGEDEMELLLPSQRHRIRPPTVTLRTRRRRQDEDATAMEEYQPYDYYNAPPKPRSIWTQIFWVALVAHLLARYGPVAPPQEANSNSWEDFCVRELTGLWRTTKLIGFTVPRYVTQWIVVGVYDDVRYYYHQYQDYSEQQAAQKQWANCSLKVPITEQDWNLQYKHEPSDVYRIVGQSRAVEVTTQAVDAWSQTLPLLLYFGGSRGAGKSELARQISERILSHCTATSSKQEDLWRNKHSPVLVLQGRDFAISVAGQDKKEETVQADEDGAEGSSSSSTSQSSSRVMRVQLYETILRHAQTYSQGSVVVLQHVEDLAEGLLATLVQDLTTTNLPPAGLLHTTNNPMEDKESHNTPSLVSRLHESCKRTIFVMTSNIGSKTIASSIRQYEGIDQIPPLEFDLLMTHELDTTFMGDDYSDESKSAKLSSSHIEIGSKFHAVAPFYPLEQESLEHILLQKVHQWNLQQQQSAPELPPLIIMKSTLHTLLDSSHVEYLTMVKRSTQKPLLTFSSAGAQFLHEGNPKMNAWQAAVKRCLRQWKKEQDDIELAVLVDNEYGNTNEEQRYPSQYAVLDADTPSHEGVLYLCPNQDGRVAFNLLYPPTTLSSCQEQCRFPL